MSDVGDFFSLFKVQLQVETTMEMIAIDSYLSYINVSSLHCQNVMNLTRLLISMRLFLTIEIKVLIP